MRSPAKETMKTGSGRKRILFVDHALGMGGAERNLLSLAGQLDSKCWAAYLACPADSFLEKAAPGNLPIIHMKLLRLRSSPRFLIDWLRGALALGGIARRIQADLLFTGTVRSAFYCALAARFMTVPFVWNAQDFWLSETRPRVGALDRLGKKFLCRSAALIIANSKATCQHLPGSDKLRMVYNGILIDGYDPSIAAAQDFRQRFRIPPQSPLVGMAARMRPWKGQQRFLRMASQVLAQIPNTRFLILGGDSLQPNPAYRRKIEQLARTLGIYEKTTFTGHLDDVRPALAAMDVFVHPGDPEPFGIVNIEAMASCKPVVGFAQGALPEIVERGKTGLLVPPGDLDGMARAVSGLLWDSDKRIEMGHLGFERVKEYFTIQQAAARFSELFEGVLR